MLIDDKFVLVAVETQRGAPRLVGDYVVTPVAEQVRIPLLQPWVGLFWSRPVAVDVQTKSGATHTLPIRDYTREILIGLAAAAALTSVLFWMLGRRRAA